MKTQIFKHGLSALTVSAVLTGAVVTVQAADKKPNVVILMTDDTGWGDFGCYGGGQNLGHPTPNIDRVAAEGAMFTCWYEGIDYNHWYFDHIFVQAPAGTYVGGWLQSFREFPPRRKPGSFNLDRVMESVVNGAAQKNSN
jgi:hypothetical protein